MKGLFNLIETIFFTLAYYSIGKCPHSMPMKNKRLINIFIFTMAIMALLLRPYFAYQLAESRQLSKDPVALNALLQRLVKKKDDHHATFASDQSVIESTQNKTRFGLPHLIPAVKTACEPILLAGQPAVLKEIYPSIAYYKLYSTFRI